MSLWVQGLKDLVDISSQVIQSLPTLRKDLCKQAAAKRREAEKLAAEKSKQEEREKRKQRLDAGFAEVCMLHVTMTFSYNEQTGSLSLGGELILVS